MRLSTSMRRSAASALWIRIPRSRPRSSKQFFPTPTRSSTRSATSQRIEPMAVEVQMPQMGESVVEGTIAKWLVKKDKTVTEDQPLVEISTDKVDTEIPSPSAGTISKLVAEEGQTLPVGAVIAVIEKAGAAAQPAKPVAQPARVVPATPEPEAAPAPKPAVQAPA